MLLRFATLRRRRRGRARLGGLCTVENLRVGRRTHAFPALALPRSSPLSSNGEQRRPHCRRAALTPLPTCAGAHAECSEMLEAHPDKVGYVFYHNQDLELAAGGLGSCFAVGLSCPVAGGGSDASHVQRQSSLSSEALCPCLASLRNSLLPALPRSPPALCRVRHAVAGPRRAR